ncbi:hypothetical protein D0865_00701 [Hortaea werneckii]|uniref:Uncharacterized protein n=1 Tax=Hortaea werneckii TaxID=91943 RepID=A0A3M7DCL0_HORWE|nr:hypothetical protein D0865_00701 [Hortaea werneckii]
MDEVSAFARIPEYLCEKFRAPCPDLYLELMVKMDRNQSTTLFPTTDRHTFELFLYWLAESRLPDIAGSIKMVPVQVRENFCNTHLNILADLWMFAWAHSIRRLQNEAMISLLEVLSCGTVKPEMLSGYFTSIEESQLEDVLLLEVAYGLLQGHYTTKEEEQFARLDGFFPTFTALARGEGKLDPRETSPSIRWNNEKDADAFLVLEKQSDEESDEEAEDEDEEE